MRILLAFACLGLGIVLAIQSYERLMRRAGPRRLAQAAAYVVAGLCYGTGLGAWGSLVHDGWLRARFTGEWMQIPLPEGIAIGAFTGLLLGLGMFAMSVRRGANPAFPPEDVEIVLADEPQATAATRAKTARRLERRARRSGMPLPPELDAYVSRNRDAARRR